MFFVLILVVFSNKIIGQIVVVIIFVDYLVNATSFLTPYVTPHLEECLSTQLVAQTEIVLKDTFVMK